MYIKLGKVTRRLSYEQASNDNIEHGGEGVAAIGDAFVNDDAGVPDKQCPGKEKCAVHETQAKTLG